MSKPYLPLFILLVLFVLTKSLSFDFSASPAPGWHITIYPRWFMWAFITLAIILFAVIGYWLHKQKQDKISWILFAVHIIFTLPAIAFIHFPAVLLNADITNQEEFINAVAYRIKLIPFAWALFYIGQFWFVIYYTRAVKNKMQAS